MFGSIVAAGLLILTALIGLSAGISLVTLAANVVNIATFGPTLAAMIGLGVGIDYALFVINRYRQAVLVGREPRMPRSRPSTRPGAQLCSLVRQSSSRSVASSSCV